MHGINYDPQAFNFLPLAPHFVSSTQEPFTIGMTAAVLYPFKAVSAARAVGDNTSTLTGTWKRESGLNIFRGSGTHQAVNVFGQMALNCVFHRFAEQFISSNQVVVAAFAAAGAFPFTFGMVVRESQTQRAKTTWQALRQLPREPRTAGLMAVGFVFETWREVLYNKMLNIKETSAQYGLSAKQRVALTLTFPLFAGILSGVPNALASMTYGILLQPKKPINPAVRPLLFNLQDMRRKMNVVLQNSKKPIKPAVRPLLFNLQDMRRKMNVVLQNSKKQIKQHGRLVLDGPLMGRILTAVLKNSEHILLSGLYRGFGMWWLFLFYNAPSLALEYLDTSPHLTVTKSSG